MAKDVPGFKCDPAVYSFKSWMLQLTRWRIINQLNKRGAEAARLVSGSASTVPQADETSMLERIPDPKGFDLEAIWESEWEKNLLSAALERVKRRVAPDQVQIFDLCCFEGWPVPR